MRKNIKNLLHNPYQKRYDEIEKVNCFGKEVHQDVNQLEIV